MSYSLQFFTTNLYTLDVVLHLVFIPSFTLDVDCVERKLSIMIQSHILVVVVVFVDIVAVVVDTHTHTHNNVCV